MVRKLASSVAKKQLGKRWADRFLERHAEELIIKWSHGIDHSRKNADSFINYKLYFELLQQKIEEYEIEPRHMYNMDEKGFLLGVGSRSKRVFSRTWYESGAGKAYIQDGSREWTTILACICADGTALPPSFIFSSANSTIQSSWVREVDTEKDEAHFASSPTGWTNNELGFAWLEQVFKRYKCRVR